MGFEKTREAIAKLVADKKVMPGHAAETCDYLDVVDAIIWPLIDDLKNPADIGAITIVVMGLAGALTGRE
jgi:hypothetical protein